MKKLDISFRVINDNSKLFTEIVTAYVKEFYPSLVSQIPLDRNLKGDFASFIKGDIKILTLQQFIEMTEEFNPKEGDLVEVSMNGTHFDRRKFIYKMSKNYNPNIITHNLTEGGFERWCYMRPIQQPQVIDITIEEIAKLKGCKPEQIRIKE